MWILARNYPTSSIYLIVVDLRTCASLVRRDHPAALRIREPGLLLLAYTIVKEFIYLSQWHRVVLQVVIGCILA
jgi:hypothetical protein